MKTQSRVYTIGWKAVAGFLMMLTLLAGMDSPAVSASDVDEIVVATMWECQPLNMKSRRSRFFSESEILDTLVKMDFESKLIPGLATSWERLSPTEWSFTLRQGVTFHDGTAFNAEAARFSLQKVLDLLPYAERLMDVASMEATDTYTLLIRTNQPFAALPNQLTDAFTSIYGKASFNEAGEFVKPIGTGPYRFVEYIKQDRTIVEAFDGYWGTAPTIKRVVYRYIPDHNTRVLALEAGEVDLAVNIPPADVARLKQSSDYTVYQEPAAGLYYAVLNCSSGPFADVRVRQAVNLLIDRDALVSVLEGVGLPAWEFFSPAFSWAPQNPPRYAPDSAKAAQLLEDAGYTKDGQKWGKEGTPLTLSIISYSTRTEMPLLIEAISGILQANGIGTDVKLYTWPGMLGLVQKGEYDAYLVYWTPEMLGHPDLHLKAHLHSASNLDYSGYKNEELDALLDQGRGLDQGPEFQEVYGKILSIIHQDAPIAPLVHKVYVAASTDSVQGFRVHPSGFFYNFKEVSKK